MTLTPRAILTGFMDAPPPSKNSRQSACTGIMAVAHPELQPPSKVGKPFGQLPASARVCKKQVLHLPAMAAVLVRTLGHAAALLDRTQPALERHEVAAFLCARQAVRITRAVVAFETVPAVALRWRGRRCGTGRAGRCGGAVTMPAAAACRFCTPDCHDIVPLEISLRGPRRWPRAAAACTFVEGGTIVIIQRESVHIWQLYQDCRVAIYSRAVLDFEK